MIIKLQEDVNGAMHPMLNNYDDGYGEGYDTRMRRMIDTSVAIVLGTAAYTAPHRPQN